jgi:hypothetical protein
LPQPHREPESEPLAGVFRNPLMLPQCFENTSEIENKPVAIKGRRLVWRDVILYPT